MKLEIHNESDLFPVLRLIAQTGEQGTWEEVFPFAGREDDEIIDGIARHLEAAGPEAQLEIPLYLLNVAYAVAHRLGMKDCSTIEMDDIGRPQIRFGRFYLLVSHAAFIYS